MTVLQEVTKVGIRHCTNSSESQWPKSAPFVNGPNLTVPKQAYSSKASQRGQRLGQSRPDTTVQITREMVRLFVGYGRPEIIYSRTFDSNRH